MRISIITPVSQNIEPLIPVFESKGIIVHKNQLHPDCDAIIGTGQVGIELLELFHKTLPEIPLINLTLDFYKTVWTSANPHGYKWGLYRDMLRKCDELWCLSNEVVLRMGEEGVDTKRCHLMKIWARFFDYEGEIKDGRYVLGAMRPYVDDKNYGWLKRACQELGIPLVQPNHGLSELEFQKIIAECSFLCTEYHETSTGGLTLLEGYKNGKVSVISNSPYNGAVDYLGDRAVYFDDTYEDLKRVLKDTWENTPQLDLEDCRNFCNAHPSKEDMVDSMIERLNILIESKR
jgi:hypothetical protein